MENMTPKELEAARRTLGLNKAEMARSLRTPYRTYQDWEAGERPIPGVCQVAVELLLKKDAWFMATIMDRVEKKLASQESTI